MARSPAWPRACRRGSWKLEAPEHIDYIKRTLLPDGTMRSVISTNKHGKTRMTLHRKKR